MTHPDPQEGDAGCLINGCGINVVLSLTRDDASNEVAKQQGNDDLSITHEGRAKDFNDDQGHKHEETKTDVFWCTKGELYVALCAAEWDDLQACMQSSSEA